MWGVPVISIRYLLRQWLLLCCLGLGLSAAGPVLAALPGPLAGVTGGGEAKVSDAQLEQSLNQVIKTLENDQQRGDLLKKLKQLRDATQKGAQEQGGVLGLIGDTLAAWRSSSKAPTARWCAGPSCSRGRATNWKCARRRWRNGRE